VRASGVALCCAGGRFDHVAAIISTLYEHEGWPIVLVTPFNLIWLLPSGEHTIVHDPTVEGTTCGVLPMGRPVREISSARHAPPPPPSSAAPSRRANPNAFSPNAFSPNAFSPNA
jgi:hypothetical protein